MKSVVVLGGYGNFGRRIAEALAGDRAYRVLVAGRDLQKARAVSEGIGQSVEPLQLDCHEADFGSKLAQIRPTLVIHTAGPFQGNSYAVPKACAHAGAHYVDIADGRQYVCGIGELDEVAKANHVLLVAGASSLPALSSAVIDEMRPSFSKMESIEHGITAGARPPGIATMQSVMGYVGKPFSRWERGNWSTAVGWQDIIRRRYPEKVGARWLANCDVPDLELFPERYPTVRSVVFRAGVGYASSTLAVWGASWLVRSGMVATLAPYASSLHAVARALEPVGTKSSAMHVTVTGLGPEARQLSRTWTLVAGQDHGPIIPCLPAVALARKVLREEIGTTGAMPCMGLLTVAEILNAIPGLDLRAL